MAYLKLYVVGNGRDYGEQVKLYHFHAGFSALAVHIQVLVPEIDGKSIVPAVHIVNRKVQITFLFESPEIIQNDYMITPSRVFLMAQENC